MSEAFIIFLILTYIIASYLWMGFIAYCDAKKANRIFLETTVPPLFFLAPFIAPFVLFYEAYILIKIKRNKQPMNTADTFKQIRKHIAMNVLDAREYVADDPLTLNSIIYQAEKFLSIINMCNRELNLPYVEWSVLHSQNYLEQIIKEK